MVYVKINEILKKKNKSKYWLIRTLNKDYKSLSNLINNKSRAIYFDTLESICNLLECEISDILEIKNT